MKHFKKYYKKDLREDLVSFLKDNSLLTIFLRRANESGNKTFINFKSSLYGIKSYFIWMDTPEGHDFWDSIDDKWFSREEDKQIVGVRNE